MSLCSRVLAAATLLALAGVCSARPTVRNVKTNAEFKKLLKHHAEVTGLPVVVDFYSDGCGPCRMVAPHYKKMAEQYKGKAVFAKVDINYNRETASAQQISSMPTFQVRCHDTMCHQLKKIRGRVRSTGERAHVFWHANARKRWAHLLRRDSPQHT
jgi:thiol-disulfide isomerase/thioredoxin